MTPKDLHFLFGQFVPRCTHDIDKRFDGYSVLQYSAGGAVDLRIDDTKYTLEGRFFWSSYPGPRIAFKPSTLGTNKDRTWVHRYLAFRGPAVDRWTAEGLFPIAPMPAPIRPGATTGDDDWAARFDSILELSRREDDLGHHRARLELELLLCELAEARASKSQHPEWLIKAKSKLEALRTDEINYEKLATDLGFSARTFRREFTRLAGLPPHRFLLAARTSHARELLAHTDLPIKEISRELGYRDVFYFTRQFRRQVGVPPGVYRHSREG